MTVVSNHLYYDSDIKPKKTNQPSSAQSVHEEKITRPLSGRWLKLVLWVSFSTLKQCRPVIFWSTGSTVQPPAWRNLCEEDWLNKH